jgi:hypothetical protein
MACAAFDAIILKKVSLRLDRSRMRVSVQDLPSSSPAATEHSALHVSIPDCSALYGTMHMLISLMCCCCCCQASGISERVDRGYYDVYDKITQRIQGK